MCSCTDGWPFPELIDIYILPDLSSPAWVCCALQPAGGIYVILNFELSFLAFVLRITAAAFALMSAIPGMPTSASVIFGAVFLVAFFTPTAGSAIMTNSPLTTMSIHWEWYLIRQFRKLFVTWIAKGHFTCLASHKLILFHAFSADLAFTHSFFAASTTVWRLV